MEIVKTYDIPILSYETEFHTGFILTQYQEGGIQFHYLYLDFFLYAILIKDNISFQNQESCIFKPASSQQQVAQIQNSQQSK